MKNITILFNAFGWVAGKGNETEKQASIPFNEYSFSGDYLILQRGATSMVYPLRVIDGYIIADEDYESRAIKK